MLQKKKKKNNFQKLTSWGNRLIDPAHGELASGLVGTGRMAEPEEILKSLNLFFSNGPLKGKKAMVTAGPTHEAIDPVRFISNHSTGKMGFAIAQELANQGAEVTLITGPTSLSKELNGINVIAVNSADEMYSASVQHFTHSDISVLSAAVADYKPATKADQKIKKKDEAFMLELVKTKDIAAELGKLKRNGQLIVGFALETENEEANAEKKLASKNFDLIVLNSLNNPGAGFGYDTNKVTIINSSKKKVEFNSKSKKEVARDIVSTIINHAHA